jgi:uncharacterized membrane protein
VDGHVLLLILMRWVHLAAASIAIGGVFCTRVILPWAAKAVDEPAREQLLLRWRRRFKMVIHTCILLLLISGIYNSILQFGNYRANPPLLHGLWGLHILLALAAFGIAIWLLLGSQPPRRHRTWSLVNLVLLLVVVAVASTLKWARESQPGRSAVTTGTHQPAAVPDR